MSLILLGALLACGSPPGESVVGDGSTPTETGGDGEDGTTTAADLVVMEQAIAGEIDASDALLQIARGGGLPVETDRGTWIFACTCAGASWSLAGDHEGWVGQPMSQTGELWWIEVEIPSPDGSLYKFTNGDDWQADPLARRYGYDEFGEYSIVTASAAHLERWPSVSAYGLAERDLMVWVPQGGSFTHTLYAHDGQNLFDPSAYWGGWRLQDSVPDDMLVVGIANTADRMEEYTHVSDTLDGDQYGGQADDYADMIEHEIRPMIESAYGTAAVVGTMGSSLGGLVSLYMPLHQPDSYDMAISLSGTVGWGSIEQHNPTIIELYAAAGHGDTAIYIDSGGNGSCTDSDADGIYDDAPDEFDNYCENLQLRDTLESAGYAFEEDLWHWWETDATHDEAAWADRVWRPLEIFASL